MNTDCGVSISGCRAALGPRNDAAGYCGTTLRIFRNDAAEIRSVVLTRPHDHDVLGRLHMTNEDVFVLTAVAVLSLDVAADRAATLATTTHGAGAETPRTAREFLDVADRERLLDTGAARDRRDIDPARRGVRRRPADRLVAFVVPDHDEQIFGCSLPRVARMPRLNIMPPSVSSDTMRRCGKPTASPKASGVTQPSCCWKRLALAHMRRGVVPFVDAGAERQDHEFVREPCRQRLHAIEALHRTTSPPSATAE